MNIKYIAKLTAFFYVLLLSFLANAITVSTTDETSIHTRTLAASCAACHGTLGNSAGGLPSLAGLNQQYFIAQMQAFLTGERKATVMHHHAKGLKADEIEQLAHYFSQQKPALAISPKPLK